jgi:hypothetical protein
MQLYIKVAMAIYVFFRSIVGVAFSYSKSAKRGFRAVNRAGARGYTLEGIEPVLKA